MSRPLTHELRDALTERMRFYRDLGLTEFYRRPVEMSEAGGLPFVAPDSSPVVLAASTLPESPSFETMGAPEPVLCVSKDPSHLETGEGTPSQQQTPTPTHANFLREESAIPASKSFPAQPQIGVTIAPPERAAALQLIREDLGDCTRCALHKGRNKIVFADGSPTARLMFVGEGPGADEDAQGLPFVGRAGQLLNNMIAAMGLKREEVYIANIVKCRPPGNRTPEPDEANTCSPFLFRQIDVVRPQVLVALGATAATYLLGQRQPLAGLRGRVHAFRGCQLIVTYHPA
ncbi:MAG: uracil-DNA glycosylase, partial [Terracidiphilus sp.]